LYLDSIDPDLVRKNRALGATGATSNPIIISDLIRSGRFDDEIRALAERGLDAEGVAWSLADRLVSDAESVFLPVWVAASGNAGWVSFELDPLLEDASGPPHAERVARYIELGKRWSADRRNRMIKTPATPAGIAALEDLAAAGVALNVTLIFSQEQYRAARDAVWRGAQRRPNGLAGFKSVYSIFVSRLDVYTLRAYPQLSPAAQGMVGVVNAKRIWRENRDFWAAHPTPLEQEIVFASTGVKKPDFGPTPPAWKYVEEFAGSDIETNPPATNDAVEASGRTFARNIERMPTDDVLAEIDRTVNFPKMADDLLREGVEKFAAPQLALLDLIRAKIGR
jgi:transaldolase